jgi:hypothetical protein
VRRPRVARRRRDTDNHLVAVDLLERDPRSAAERDLDRLREQLLDLDRRRTGPQARPVARLRIAVLRTSLTRTPAVAEHLGERLCDLTGLFFLGKAVLLPAWIDTKEERHRSWR